MINFDVIVIGGGAAGIMAAGHSAEQGNKVLLLEKMNYPGRKLGITGKGRCNITNTVPLEEFISQVKSDGEFLRPAFSKFYSPETIQFFNKIGVKTIQERGKRVFPKSGKAVELVKMYTKWSRSKNVQIQNNCKVNELIVKGNAVVGIKATLNENNKERKTEYFANKIILATGGASYPATGSTGDGYKLAKAVGHNINQVFPALVPLEIEKDIASSLAGLSLRNIKAKVFINGKLESENFGEMTFLNTGISGPIILSLSRVVVAALIEHKKVKLSVDLKPALGEIKLENRLIRDLESYSKESFRNILNKLLPKKLIPHIIQITKIEPFKKGFQISIDERTKLRDTLKNVKFKITGYRPFAEAIITAGGIDTKEVNPETMESNLVSNLYFAGEILDLDAPTGGYNLQIAFSTGWLAGEC